MIEVAKNGDLEEVKILIQMGVDITVENNNALRSAAANGHLPVVQYLVEYGADVSDLEIAWGIHGGSLSIVQYLVEHITTDVNHQDNWVSLWDAEKSRLPFIKYLSEQDADVPAQVAKIKNYLDIVEYLETLKEKNNKETMMKYVIVKTYSAAIFAGELKSRNRKEVVLRNAIKI